MHTDIRRNKETRDWSVFAILDGKAEYLGSRASRMEAEELEREYRMNYFLDAHTPEATAAVIRETY